ncbi:NAD(P)H-binding protein [Sorangium sp. So ce295]|uniref:NAD(P)H-binding protein n=1 Tax=Sorangium sp. So ce295 TaxID=3133295 RepID=UPI003F640C11
MSKRSETESPKHIVVVGAGQIGTPLVEQLAADGHRVTWCSRTKPASMPMGVEHRSVDARDGEALAEIARGARAMIAAVNPATYDADVWAETLPPLHRGLIEGASRAGVRLVLLDALYLYTLREGPLSPDTRHAAETEKGKIRMQIADMYTAAQRAGTLRAVIFRASDFWGPDLTSALLTRDGLRGLKNGKRPMLIGDPDAPHAFTHRDDVVNGLIKLAFAGDDVEGRVFHAPVIHVSQRELVQAVAHAMRVAVRPIVARRWLLRVAGLFSRSAGGIVEMLPQWEQPYLVDDSSYTGRFGARAITLQEGVAQLAKLTPALS